MLSGYISLIKSNLESNGAHTLTATNGAEAVAMAQVHQDTICCIVLDLVMPGQTADETVASISQINPQLPVILMSGFGSHRLTPELAHHPFIRKPFEINQLFSLILNTVHA